MPPLTLRMDIVRDLMERAGITSLYPPQEEAIGPAVEGRDLLLSVPTAAGKSLVGYAALLAGYRRGAKGLYLVPLRALATEKYDDLRAILPKEARIALSMGEYALEDRELGDMDIVVATSEKADALMRHRNPFFEDIAVCVADEIHTMTDPRRGPTLEVVLSRLKRRRVQIVGLSATIGNAVEVADWLGADLISSDWRPVRLREGVLHGGSLEYIDGERREVEGDWRTLLAETVSSGAQALVFTRGRREAERQALDHARALGLDGPELEVREEWGALGTALAEALRGGVGFHHAGLGNALRRTVERAFRHGEVRLLFATPTLAAGINLPARRVIVTSTRRFERGVGMTDIPVLEIRQMMGRAGRPGLDPYGEAIIVANKRGEARRAVEEYILGAVEPITSKLFEPRALRVHVLSAIAAGECHSLEGLRDFLDDTFFAHSTDLWHVEGILDDTLGSLAEHGFIETGEGLRATALGQVTARTYVDPASALLFTRAQAVMPEGPFHHLAAIAASPDLFTFAARSDEEGIGAFVDDAEWLFDVHGGPLLGELNDEGYSDVLKTAAVLNAWTQEMPEGEMADLFGVGPGDLRSLVEGAGWIGGAYADVTTLARRDRSAGAREISARLQHGVRPELLAIMRVPGIGRRRGRALHDAGFGSVAALADASMAELERLPSIGPATARQVIDWARRAARSHRPSQ